MIQANTQSDQITHYTAYGQRLLINHTSCNNNGRVLPMSV